MDALTDLLTALQPWAGPIGGLGGSLVTLAGLYAKQKSDARTEARHIVVDNRTFTQSERDALIKEAAEYRQELRDDLNKSNARLDDCEKSRDEARDRFDDLDSKMRMAMMRIGELELDVRAMGGVPSPPAMQRSAPPALQVPPDDSE